ncbi:MAG: enoyl-CoA hydratase/isomerase family protein [Burkholderiaceae bacterium]
MSEPLIQLDQQDGIAWITINRPKAFNALNLPAMQALFEIANRISSDSSVRCAVLTGAGDKAFCAGGDVAGFAADPDDVQRLLKEMTAYLHNAVSRLAWMDAPLIGAVNGVAAGAGLSMAACTDLAIAAKSASFTSAYTKIGLTPDGSSTYFVSRILGRRRAMEMFLTNRVLSSQEALEWGLVNEVVDDDQLREAVGKLAAKLAKGPTRAHGGVKKLMQMALNDTLESQLERETRSIVEMSQTQDGLEGVAAFVGKRKPDFTGQ